MSRTIGAGLAAHIATGRTRLAHCLRLDLRDGTSIGITSLDVDIDVDLGDGVLTYKADTGIVPSAASTAIGFEADNLEARGPLGSLVTRAAVLGGRFNQARARLFDVKWDSPALTMAILAGKVSAASVEAGEFVFEIRSATDAFNQTIGRIISPTCSHDFGVGQCQAIPLTWLATVSAVTDDLRFTVNWGSSPVPTAADIRNGLVEFSTGALAGTLPVEVFDYAGGVIDLYQPLAEAPQIGDALTVTEGCEKTRDACKLKGQILNFGGFPDLTGTDAYVKFPNPGGG